MLMWGLILRSRRFYSACFVGRASLDGRGRRMAATFAMAAKIGQAGQAARSQRGRFNTGRARPLARDGQLADTKILE